ncbi:MAG: molybdopterin-dependent oxidoreductase, partial [Spirochaeta sp.]|nr:molybdopterin-dependent oxidoreductase [Spirochaeta sp.]
PAAVAALKTGRPVQLIFERVEDMTVTSKRHASRIRLRTALDSDNNILAVDIDAVIDAGAYESSSRVVLQRCMFTGNGVYDFPSVRVHGRAVATNTVPADAFRGFGAPQGLFAIETHMSHVAREIGEDEDEFRMRYWTKNGGKTVTNGTLREEVKLDELLARVKELSDYDRKNAEYTPGSGRGIALAFVQHGSGFTGSGERDIIKAKVKLRRTAEGEVVVHASNVEIGQGIDTAFCKIAGGVLDIPYSEIQLVNTDTDATPDSGPTCASRSASVVGYEVEVDPVTLEIKVEGIYCAFDVGRAIDELVVEGQIHGGMVQGLGYATIEKMENKGGRFQQVTMADYCIPTSLDFPSGIKSALVDNPYQYGPSGAKGAGEVVLDGAAPALALAVQKALNLTVSRIPLTPEYLAEVRSHARDTVYA